MRVSTNLWRFCLKKPTVFISYSHADSKFADWLADKLRSSGVDVWIDKWMIRVGDSITQKVNEGIGVSDFLIVILSRSSTTSKWVREEVNAALIKNVEEEKHAFILPVLLEECEIPPLLRQRRYANFKDVPEEALQELLAAILPRVTDLGATGPTRVLVPTMNKMDFQGKMDSLSPSARELIVRLRSLGGACSVSTLEKKLGIPKSSLAEMAQELHAQTLGGLDPVLQEIYLDPALSLWLDQALGKSK